MITARIRVPPTLSTCAVTPALVVHGGAAELMSPAWSPPPFILGGNVPSLLAWIDSADRQAVSVLFIAQGAAGDSLLALARGAAQTVPGLTLVRAGSDGGSRR